MSLRRIRDELRHLRQLVEGRGGGQIIVEASKEDAADGRRLPADATLIIVNTGIVRR